MAGCRLTVIWNMRCIRQISDTTAAARTHSAIAPGMAATLSPRRSFLPYLRARLRAPLRRRWMQAIPAKGWNLARGAAYWRRSCSMRLARNARVIRLLSCLAGCARGSRQRSPNARNASLRASVGWALCRTHLRASSLGMKYWMRCPSGFLRAGKTSGSSAASRAISRYSDGSTGLWIWINGLMSSWNYCIPMTTTMIIWLNSIRPRAHGREPSAQCLRGAALLLDYGFPRREYYHPQRSQGTLMCHYRHHAHPDPFFWPGLQDITAHVDFSGIADAALATGAELLGYTSQARFLINSGIADALAELDPLEPARFLPAANTVHKLLSEAEMGELYKVIGFGRGIDQSALDFAFATGDRSQCL